MWWLFILGPLALLLVVLCVRAAMFTPTPRVKTEPLPVVFDEESAIESLRRMVRCKTVSYRDAAKEDSAEFDQFLALLVERFPSFHKACACEHIGKRGLLYRWAGKDSGNVTVLMAHYDVVPAELDAWSKPAFEGIREDGEIWGRGTLDTKSTLCAALSAAETLIQQGFTPAHDVYFAFGGDEEIIGADAAAIVEALHTRGTRPALVLDEGGAVVEGVFPGVHVPCALIGTAEKGMLNVEFHVNSAGGHASAPPPHTPIGVLARAVERVENKPFPMHMSKPAAEMFDTLGRYSTFAYKLMFANLWCFSGVLDAICKKRGGELNALLRTTCAFTMAQGGVALNVLPPSASVCANLRLMEGDTVQSAAAYLKLAVADDAVSIDVINGSDPSNVSPTNSAGWAKVCSAVEQTWPEALVSPYLMVACSDSRYFCRISDNVLRFSAMALSGDDRKRIHAHDERVEEAKFLDAIRFYLRLEQQC